MKLPPLQGNLDQNNFFIYAASDTQYFDEFGPYLIHSIQRNSQAGLHLHLYNPTAEQIRYCRAQDRVSITFEYAPIELFEAATQPWLTPPKDPELSPRYKNIITSMTKGNDASIQVRIQKTFFACARFIRLQQLIKPTTSVLAIDIDAIVRHDIKSLSNIHDLYIHHIDGKKARYLAGGICLPGTNNGYNFLMEYAEVLKKNIVADNLYWGIDQDVLAPIVPKYHWSQLPSNYIDWEMRSDSYIWTAKGERKKLEVFKTEKLKYKD